mmetsp:Transcript_34855/g.42052  ORF Transcript_34855/g.42052 Transcript_34855/m.42052 type:complete len:332 (+) Transcript_34855:76-1071(+)
MRSQNSSSRTHFHHQHSFVICLFYCKSFRLAAFVVQVLVMRREGKVDGGVHQRCHQRAEPIHPLVVHRGATDDNIGRPAHDGVHPRACVALGQSTRAPDEQTQHGGYEQRREDRAEDLPLPRIEGDAVRYHEQRDGKEDFRDERVAGRHFADGAGSLLQAFVCPAVSEAVEDERTQNAADRLRCRVQQSAHDGRVSRGDRRPRDQRVDVAARRCREADNEETEQEEVADADVEVGVAAWGRVLRHGLGDDGTVHHHEHHHGEDLDERASPHVASIELIDTKRQCSTREPSRVDDWTLALVTDNLAIKLGAGALGGSAGRRFRKHGEARHFG